MNKKKEDSWTDKAASKIARLAVKVQTLFANQMNRQFSNLPSRQIKLLLFMFCFASGGFSIYLAAHAIFGGSGIQPSYPVTPIERPKHIDRTGSEINEAAGYVTEETYYEIQKYKQYMDSLQQPIRPGLLDSIRVLEEIYHSQLK